MNNVTTILISSRLLRLYDASHIFGFTWVPEPVLHEWLKENAGEEGTDWVIGSVDTITHENWEKRLAITFADDTVALAFKLAWQ